MAEMTANHRVKGAIFIGTGHLSTMVELRDDTTSTDIEKHRPVRRWGILRRKYDATGGRTVADAANPKLTAGHKPTVEAGGREGRCRHGVATP